jgi:multiple sugar transport system substrate-binding protein
MKRNIAVSLALTAVIPLALAGCSSSTGSGGSSGNGVVVLSELDYQVDEPSSSQMKAVLDECAAQVGAKIDRQTVPGGQLISRVLQAAQSRTLPDLVRIDNPDVQQIAATGGLSPLGDYGITGEGTAKGILDASTYEGKLYGLQPQANTLGFFYNKKLLAAAGQKVPKTWDELVSTSAAVSHGDVYGFASAAALGGEGGGFLPFMWSNGGDEANLKSPQVAGALELYKKLEDTGGMSKSVVNWTQSDVTDQFTAGKAALMVAGSWNMGRLADSKLDWGVAELPVPKAGDTPIQTFGGEAWTVPVTGDKTKQAKAAQMVTCLASDAMQLKQAKASVGQVPAKTAVAKQLAQESPELAPFVSSVANGRARTGEIGLGWPKAATTIYAGVQLVLTGQAAPADAMAQAAQS